MMTLILMNWIERLKLILIKKWMPYWTMLVSGAIEILKQNKAVETVWRQIRLLSLYMCEIFIRAAKKKKTFLNICINTVSISLKVLISTDAAERCKLRVQWFFFSITSCSGRPLFQEFVEAHAVKAKNRV